VDRTSYELLSGSAFASDKDSRIGQGNQLNSLHNFAETGAITDDVTEVMHIADRIKKAGLPGK
jgi:hypothetical protein